jgi:hypothetical protein
MKLSLLVVATLLAGCAGLRVQYNSDPPGASLYEGGQLKGVTPVVLNYELDQAFKSGGCTTLRGTSVKWASGAEASISHLTACAHVGRSQQYTFQRPDVPGRDVDMNYALQVQRNTIMRQQAAAAETAATLQLINALNPPPPPLPTSINCSSYRLGNTIQTDCR